MRKFLKNNLLEIFPTIYEAHKIIENYIKEKNFENAKAILIDCQNSAVQLGSIVENSEGKGFITVGILEEYCKLVYEVFISISDESNSSEIKDKLDKKLDSVRNSVENDIKVKLEIVFMPYKASMWDSLESVWKAADANPDYDTYVVSIPYYDRNSNRSFGQCHYEGLEFPDYVPVTHFNKYNIAQRKPDIIYIHNPYDDCNFVTSVDPRFYSRELKKHTEKLVYIPYFVLEEIEIDDWYNINQIKHFITTPGVINSDEVIVQSEKMKTIYVNVLLETFGDTTENKRLFENKIKGTGSPKFDKIQNTNINDISIPEDWKRVIYKSDGSRKKVVFYNIGISSFLKNSEKCIKKIVDSLKIFKENLCDVALLWRPHPLIQATIESMRPQLWKEYKKIVENYISEGWGIYDDTADLNRAIVLSDVYYGDESSVVQLYQKTGKPVMIQNVYVNYNKSSLSIQSAVKIDNHIYITCVYDNLLFKINTENGHCELKGIFDVKSNYYLYSNGIVYKDKIYWIPLNAEKIAIYDIKTEEIIYLDLPENIPLFKKNKFYTSFLYNEHIYMFGKMLSCVLILDCKTNTMKEIELYPEISMGYDYSIVNNEVFVPLIDKNQNCYKIMRFDLINYCYSVINIPCDNSLEQAWFTQVTCENEKLIFYDWYDYEYELNLNNNEIKIKKNSYLNYPYKPYRTIVKSSIYNKCIRIPFFSPEIICEDTKGNVKKIDYSKIIQNNFYNDEYSFLFALEDGQYVWFQKNSSCNNNISCINIETFEVKDIQLSFSNYKITNKKTFIYEGEFISLEDFFNKE